MTFSRITVCLTVEETDEAKVLEALNALIDSFVVHMVPVFDSDIKAVPICDVENAEDVTQETPQPSSPDSEPV